MTQQEWDNATEEERNAELSKCHDEPWYYYNTYYKPKEAPEITKEEWNNILGYSIVGSRRRHVFDPVRISQKVKFKQPAKSAYDGSAIRRHYVDYGDPYYIPIQIAIDNPELYQKLLEQQRQRLEYWRQLFPLKLDESKIKGKVFISTISDDDKNANYWKSIWEDAMDDKPNKLNRFFTPIWTKKEDK